ncbi:MAG: hypothetical protein M5R42_17665 [Rhodocyclaceae bacterium]|nr:hypothetical protein [Rhodocyclaceae bacterium]
MHYFRRSRIGPVIHTGQEGGYRMQASILQFLKTSGEGLDIDIAKALRMPVKEVKSHVSRLSSEGEVICCDVTRYVDGKKKSKASAARLSGNLPSFSRGPKPGAKRAATKPK